MPTKFITVKNPANGRLGVMSERAFERVFKEKGFTKVSDNVDAARAGRDPVVAAQRRDAEAEKNEPKKTKVRKTDKDEDTTTE